MASHSCVTLRRDVTLGGPCSVGSQCCVGWQCPANATFPQLCPPGRYSDGDAGDNACQPCFPGFACVGWGVSSARATPCGSDPPPGYACQGGDATTAGQPCPRGRYSRGAGAPCSFCPPGSLTDVRIAAATSATDCGTLSVTIQPAQPVDSSESDTAQFIITASDVQPAVHGPSVRVAVMGMPFILRVADAGVLSLPHEACGDSVIASSCDESLCSVVTCNYAAALPDRSRHFTVEALTGNNDVSASISWQLCPLHQYSVAVTSPDTGLVTSNECKSCSSGTVFVGSGSLTQPPCRRMIVSVTWLPSGVANTSQFRLTAYWSDDGITSGVGEDDVDARGLTFTVRVDGAVGPLGQPHAPCSFANGDDVAQCDDQCAMSSCLYAVVFPEVNKDYQLQVSVAGFPTVNATLTWQRCSPQQYTVIRWREPHATEVGAVLDSLRCAPCPVGGRCDLWGSQNVALAARTVVQRHNIVADSGWWSPSNGSDFYRCLYARACLRPRELPANASVECTHGFGGRLCGECSPGYMLHNEDCHACPSSRSPASRALLIVAPFVALAVLIAVVVYRETVSAVVPISALKVTVSMLQLLAAASNGYAIPWPSPLSELLRGMGATWLDINLFLRMDCRGQDADFLSQTLMAFVVFKGIIGVVVVAMLVEPKLRGLWSTERLQRLGRCL